MNLAWIGGVSPNPGAEYRGGEISLTANLTARTVIYDFITKFAKGGSWPESSGIYLSPTPPTLTSLSHL